METDLRHKARLASPALFKAIEQRLIPVVEFIEIKRNLFLLATIELLSIAGVKIFLLSTSQFGVGIADDSIEYLIAARSLTKGLGYNRINGYGMPVPITHWPPLYPLLLSLFGLSNSDPQIGARWLGAFLFGVNIFLAGILLFRLTRSYWFAVTGSLIMMLAPVIVETSLYAMSEPLYITFTLVSFIILDQFRKSAQGKWLILLGITLALALLTRYVGLALILTCVFGILWMTSRSWRERIKSALILAAVALLPNVLWLIHNYLAAGTLTNRALIYQPIPASSFNAMMHALSLWRISGKRLFLPELYRLSLSFIFIIGLFIQSKLQIQRETSPVRSPGISLVIIFHAITYIIFILASRVFFDSSIPINEARILSPFYLSLMLLVLLFLDFIGKQLANRNLWIRSVLVVGCVFFIVAFVEYYSNVTGSLLAQNYNSGLGFTSKTYGYLKMPAHIGELPQNYIIYTNNIEKLYYFGGQRGSNAFYEVNNESVESIKKDIADHGGVIIAYFDNSPGAINQILSALPETKFYYHADDGFILVATR